MEKDIIKVRSECYKDYDLSYTAFIIEKLKKNKFIPQRALIEFNALFLYAKFGTNDSLLNSAYNLN